MLRAHQKKVFASFGILAMLALGSPFGQVEAATATTTFSVTATVTATCLISATSLAFGSYTGALATATATVSVTCTNTTPYNVGLDPGTSSGATATARKMTGPSGALLGYGLYQDSAHSIVWGNTVGTNTVTGTGNGSAQALTVYGQVPAGQYVTPGAYTDTITATVTY